ncbi:MAG: hypothetical protein RQ756_06840, partial [Flavobacteriaceae bacterium]|nr:hypothetical protein [Flavobacteriaceae bacterium]
DVCFDDAQTQFPFDATDVVNNYSDTCGDVSIVNLRTNLIGDDCDWTLTYTYDVVDECGNTLFNEVITHTGSDQSIPVIDNPDDFEICNDPLTDSLTASWTDNCSDGGDITSAAPRITDLPCQQIAEYDFDVADDCGNEALTETTTVTRNFDLFENCETAFGRLDDDSRCFLQDGFSRWGWTNEIPAEGTYTMDLYAGAAQCDITKGNLVGDVLVDYNNGQVTVTYNILPGFVMSEGHVYIGCDMYPTRRNGVNTVAPGQYPFNFGSLDYGTTYSLGPIDVTGPFYIIAHAVVCEETCRCSVSSDNGTVFYPNGTGDTIDCGPFDIDDADSVDAGDNNTPDAIDFNAYPVPFKDVLNIDYNFDFLTNVKLEIFDVRGVLVYSEENNNYRAGTKDGFKVSLPRTGDQLLIVKMTTSKGSVIKKVVSID